MMNQRVMEFTPIGPLTLSASAEALLDISFGRLCKREQENLSDALLANAVLELGEYFSGQRTVFSVPLAPQGTPFQQLVWKALLRIPYGEVRSYGEIAAAIGRPGAARAVGGANHKNPVPILIPCHRVIGADGSLTGYGGGLSIKEKLLELEKRYMHL